MLLSVLLASPCSPALISGFVDLTGQLVDTIEVAREIDFSERIRIPLLLVLLAATRGIGGYLGGYSMAYIANTVVHHIRTQLLGRFYSCHLSFMIAVKLAN